MVVRFFAGFVTTWAFFGREIVVDLPTGAYWEPSMIEFRLPDSSVDV